MVRSTTRRLSCGIVLLVAAATPAQQQFEPAGREHLIDRGLLRLTDDVALEDLNGDGRPDLIVTNVGLSLFWTELWTYENDGQGRLVNQTSRVRAGTSTRAQFTIGDVDGDGDSDIVWDQYVFANNGSGGFTVGQQLSHAAALVAELGDVDGDGDLDLFTGQFSQSLKLHRNDGTGRFGSTSTPLSLPVSEELALVDLDGDGDLDLVTAPAASPPATGAAAFLNDGTGSLTRISSIDFPTIYDRVLAIAVGDIDGDGDADLAFATDGRNLLYLNMGGRFLNAGPLELTREQTDALALHDVDRNGTLDVVISSPCGGNRVLLGDGSGGFQPAAAPLPGDSGSAVDFAFGDVDGDGIDDLYCGRYVRDNLLWGLPNGEFAIAGDIALPALGSCAPYVEFGDVDGDGDRDILLLGDPEALYRNDGSGRFTLDATAVPDNGLFTDNGELGDIDGDGDLDVMLAADARPQLYLNDGTGRFTDGTAGRVPQVNSFFPEVFLADFDNDGDLDLYGRSPTASDYLLINDGTGRFRDEGASRLPSTTVTLATGLAIEDFDGDGDLDMIAVGSSPLYWLNDGTGHFRDVSSRLPFFFVSFGLGAGDVDGDGDLDVVVERDILLNDGAGNFSVAPAANLPRPISPPSGGPTLMDADRDGDLDLLYGGDVVEGWRNNGSGVFRRAPLLTAIRSGASNFGDIDGDGDEDLLAGASIYRNNHRQLTAPRTPRVGDTYRLELFARPGYGVLPKYAIVALGQRQTHVCLPPFGCWRVDLGSAVFLPIVAIGPGGHSTVPLPIPSTAALRGAGFVVQGLMLDFDGDSGFTNWIGDVIR